MAYKPQGRTRAKPPEHRPNARERGYTWRWEQARATFLAEHPLCAEHDRQGQPLTPATVVDHVRPHKGNERRFWDSENNWEATCATCHNRKTMCEQNLPKYRRTIVTGPPGSGKSTYVNKHRKPGDLVWDWDEVAKVMLQLPMHETPSDCIPHLNAMAEVLCREVATRCPARDVWIILTNVDRAKVVAEMVSGEVVEMHERHKQLLGMR